MIHPPPFGPMERIDGDEIRTVRRPDSEVAADRRAYFIRTGILIALLIFAIIMLFGLAVWRNSVDRPTGN